MPRMAQQTPFACPEKVLSYAAIEPKGTEAGPSQFDDGRDCLLFYEYFHGDNGAGMGRQSPTRWTGVIARIMHQFST
jgi:hypothetical protein